MDIAKHFSILLFVLIVYSINTLLMYGSTNVLTVSYPSPPDSNPLSYLTFLGSAISWLFNNIIAILQILYSAMTFSIYPYPLNAMLSIVFGVLLFYGAYPFIVMLVKIIAEIIKGIGNIIPFT